MLRRIASLLLLVSLLWNPVAWASCIGGGQGSEQATHLSLHWQESDHHHHEDGSLHTGDSGGAEHQHADTASSPLGLVAEGWNSLPAPARSTPPVSTALAHPAPTLDGPLRPPQARA